MEQAEKQMPQKWSPKSDSGEDTSAADLTSFQDFASSGILGAFSSGGGLSVDSFSRGITAFAPFALVRTLQLATSKHSQVSLVEDGLTHGGYRVVKKIPNVWVKGNHPTEHKRVWMDIAVNASLRRRRCAYAPAVFGVCHDQIHTYVESAFFDQGDLFDWCSNGVQLGHSREDAFRPLARQIFHAVRHMHDMGIAHGNLCLENIVLTNTSSGTCQIGVIDYGMATTKRYVNARLRGTSSYLAPEMTAVGEEYDAFVSDTFALGVVLFSALLQDYPWMSTHMGKDKGFGFLREHGFRALVDKRHLRNSNRRMSDVLSEPLIELLDGLLACTPETRLTLGEAGWKACSTPRKSVWDMEWMRVSTDSE